MGRKSSFNFAPANVLTPRQIEKQVDSDRGPVLNYIPSHIRTEIIRMRQKAGITRVAVSIWMRIPLKLINEIESEKGIYNKILVDKVIKFLANLQPY